MQFSPLVLPLVAATGLLSLLAVRAWRQRRVPGADRFALLLVSAAFWAFTSIFEIVSTDLSGKLFWANLKFVGVIGVVLAWFAFALRYTDTERSGWRLLLWVARIEGAVFLAVAWTSEAHGLVRRSTWLEDFGATKVVRSQYGEVFWLHTGFGSFLLVLGLVILLRSLWSRSGVYRWQALSLFPAIAVPSVLLAGYLGRLGPLAQIDLTPFGFVVSGLLLLYSLFRLRFLDLAPVRRPTGFFEIADGVVLTDSQDRIIDVNPAAVRFLESPAHRLIGLGCRELLAGRGINIPLAWDESGTPATFTSRNGGVSRDLEFRVSPIVDADGRPTGTILLIRDITESVAAEAQIRQVNTLLASANAALRESEARYRDLVENAPDVIYSHDLTGKFLAVNSTIEEASGYTVDEILSMNISELVAPDHLAIAREMTAKKIAGDDLTVYELDVIGKDGRRITVEVSSWIQRIDGRPVSVHGVARDITLRRQLEAQLHQSQKMEALGQLAGGVAHDFNNLLTAINGFGELLLESPSLTLKDKEYVSQIRNAGDHAAAMTGQLLAFSRGQRLQPTVIDLGMLVEQLRPMLSRLIPEDIEIAVQCDDQPQPIFGDRAQIQQVVLNLALNARDAMPQGGRLTVRTNVERDPGSSSHGVGELKDRVCLTVSDTGIGMDSATLARIFEPFFTTKEAGKGTGLGLATVYGIVTQSGGTIDVTSQPGLGTTFSITIPRHNLAGTEAVRNSGLAVPRELTGRTALLVEDEPSVRAFCRELLTARGCLVLEGTNGKEGLAIAEDLNLGIDFMVSDLVMPAMNGRELAQRVLQIRPDLPIVLMSGYADRAIWTAGDLPPSVLFLAKPFPPASLIELIRRLLESEDSSQAVQVSQDRDLAACR